MITSMANMTHQMATDIAEMKKFMMTIGFNNSSNSEQLVSTELLSNNLEVLEEDMELGILWQMPLKPNTANIDMDRKSINTVGYLVDKWYILREGTYSFIMREKKWGSSWLVNDKHFHNRMKKIINVIDEGLAMIHKDETLTRDDMGKLLDEYRKTKGFSVYQLSAQLKRELLQAIHNLFQEKEVRLSSFA